MTTKTTLLMIASLLTHFLVAQHVFDEEAKYKGKPIVEMMINEKPVWVLLDTGSDITILNSDKKEELGFSTIIRPNEQLTVHGFGSSNNKLQRVYGAKIYFGNTRLHCSLVAYDMSEISKSIKSRTGKEISAIVGMNLLKKYGFVIDLRNGTASMTQRIEKGKEHRTSSVDLFAIKTNLQR